ncbi:unnamed protein product [Boreogadus saida]
MTVVPVLLEGQRYVPTYRFSQDHLELLFNSIRASGGWNNYPYAGQFKWVWLQMADGPAVELLNHAEAT